jgi:CYTH domain-containing protein
MEVERKWVVAEAPAAAMADMGEPIEQGYLAIAPDGDEVRVRRRGQRHYLTAKRGSGLVREEFEVELTAAQYEALWPGTAGRRVEKNRRVIDAGDGLAIEFDEYSGSLSGLLIAEVEFPDEAAAARFEAPAWFTREVTDETGYRNQQLALHGLPETTAGGPLA